jgi:SAM-dependent methyltransferase
MVNEYHKKADATRPSKPAPPAPPSIEDVRTYWQSHPLYSYEFMEPGSDSYFVELDRIKRQDIERFALDYWGFDQYAGQRVLDVGCGPGWITVQYARGGAQVEAIDLTPRAVELARRHVQFRQLSANVQEANAEHLPFGDNTFDLVVSSGVLHHTPDTVQAFRECFRVLKPGQTAKITLYRKGILHRRGVFPIMMSIMRLLGVKHPGADMAGTAPNADDFIRQYDGAGNPIGRGMTDADWKRSLEGVGFRVTAIEHHFFPVRFIPSAKWITSSVHRVLDSAFGTMVYFTMRKPA